MKKNTSNEGLTELRKAHTLRTIEAVGILKGAFEQIDKMQLLINDRDLKIQELQNALLMARSIAKG